jgi:hypothetical protein
MNATATMNAAAQQAAPATITNTTTPIIAPAAAAAPTAAMATPMTAAAQQAQLVHNAQALQIQDIQRRLGRPVPQLVPPRQIGQPSYTCRFHCLYTTPFLPHMEQHERSVHTAMPGEAWFACPLCVSPIVVRARKGLGLSAHVTASHRDWERASFARTGCPAGCTAAQLPARTGAAMAHIQRHYTVGPHDTRTVVRCSAAGCTYQRIDRSRGTKAHFCGPQKTTRVADAPAWV